MGDSDGAACRESEEMHLMMHAPDFVGNGISCKWRVRWREWGSYTSLLWNVWIYVYVGLIGGSNNMR